MVRFCKGFVIAGFALVSSTAFGVALRHKPGSETWTRPAGSDGQGHVDVVTTADYYGLRVITLWDHDGRICAVQLEQTGFATGTESVLERVKVCEPKVAESWKRADVGEGNYVTAVAACVGGEEGGLRGLEIWGSPLSPTGVARAPVNTARFAFEDCAWSETRACPAGQIATGIRLFVDGAGEGAVGIALRCHRLEPR